ncbi:MAG: helix-turn-helix transcriptional regulator [Sphingomonas bacterium]
MAEVIAPSRLSEIIGLIYDSALDRDRWPIAMEAMRIALDCCNAALALQSLEDGRLILNLTTNIAEPYVAMLADAGPDVIELWGGEEAVKNMAFEEPQVMSRAPGGFNDFTTTTNRYALEWARPQGIVDALACGLARDSRAFGSLNFGRHESRGLVGEQEIELARLLIPHLQRAATITRLYDTAAAAGSAFEEVLAALRLPVMLVTRDLRLIHANPAARAALDNGFALSVWNGVLHARVPGVGMALASAVARAADDEARMERQGFGIPIRGWEGGRAALHVMPLRRRRLGIDHDAVAAIFVAEADAPAMAPASLIAALFDLTPAEARVYEQISKGLSVPQSAERLGVKISTVKTHLLRLFEKTGTRKQTELVLLAMSLAAPLTG